MGLLRKNSGSGRLEDLENRRDGAIGEVSEFITYLRDARQEAQEVVDEVETARSQLDEVENDAKPVIEFVDQLPSFNGGDN